MLIAAENTDRGFGMRYADLADTRWSASLLEVALRKGFSLRNKRAYE